MKKPLTRDNITEYMDKMSKVNMLAASLLTTWGHQDKQNCKHLLETVLSLTNVEQAEIIHAANGKKKVNRLVHHSYVPKKKVWRKKKYRQESE